VGPFIQIVPFVSGSDFPGRLRSLEKARPGTVDQAVPRERKS
jgi:hypothetical protein